MATWDNSDLGLAGWCKVVGGSRDVPGCPMATWDNWDLILSTTRNIPCIPNGLRCT